MADEIAMLLAGSLADLKVSPGTKLFTGLIVQSSCSTTVVRFALLIIAVPCWAFHCTEEAARRV